MQRNCEVHDLAESRLKRRRFAASEILRLWVKDDTLRYVAQLRVTRPPNGRATRVLNVTLLINNGRKARRC
jgi:hypothetical protein